MPYKEFQDVVDILNSSDTWRELGGSYMGYSLHALDKFAMAVHRPQGSPADAMLTHWGTKNHTVLQLFKLLGCMQHFQAMEAIKSLVPEKYHVGATVGTTISTSCNKKVNDPPPPPFKYDQAKKDVVANLDVDIQKDYSTRKISEDTTTKSDNCECNAIDFDGEALKPSNADRLPLTPSSLPSGK